MAHHKRTRIRCRSAKRKRHRKSKRVCYSDRGTCLERAKHLYIIGNGFDLHHHIPSSYNDFKEWLEDNDIDTLYKVENILKTDAPKWWNEFETNLGKPFAVKLYAESVAFENQPDYASDDYRDRDLYVAEYEVERELGCLINDLKSDFQEWASQLPAGDGGLAVKLETKGSIFLTFNYSLTLEKLYGIPADRVKHIHGNALDKESIIVGHGRDYGSYRNDLEDEMPEPPSDLPTEEYERWLEDAADRYSDDYPTSQAKDAAAYAIKDIQKNVPSIIAKNREFFQSLKDIEKIHIYGFSFAEVNLPYLIEVTHNVNMESIEMEISYYSDNDKKKAETFCELMSLTPKNVTFIKLENIKRYKQLSLFELPV